MTTRERIVLSAHLLVSIEGERQRRNVPGLFRAVEQEIIWRELADLEAECSRSSLAILVRGNRRPAAGSASHGPANSPPEEKRFS